MTPSMQRPREQWMAGAKHGTTILRHPYHLTFAVPDGVASMLVALHTSRYTAHAAIPCRQKPWGFHARIGPGRIRWAIAEVRPILRPYFWRELRRVSMWYPGQTSCRVRQNGKRGKARRASRLGNDMEAWRRPPSLWCLCCSQPSGRRMGGNRSGARFRPRLGLWSGAARCLFG